MEHNIIPEDDCQALLEYLLQDEHALRQQFEASVDLAALLSPPSAEGSGPPPPGQADPDVRWFGLLGDILWEIFSQNNEVVGPDGRVYDLGSWRGSGGFIADFLNRCLASQSLADEMIDGPFIYLDFYMGLMISDEDEAWEVPLRLLYGHFFERLKAHGCTWRYAPPAIYLISFTKDEEKENPASYDPASAVQKALDEESYPETEQDEDHQAQQLAQSNEAAYWHAVEEPPRIVRAYREVYGEMPPYIRPGA